MIGSASRTAFCVFVSSLRGTGCAALRDNEYLDVGGGLFGRQGDWACDCDGCEQHCGESGELHGDDGLFVVGLGWVWKVCLASSLGVVLSCVSRLIVELGR